MKNITVLALAITAIIYGCYQSSDKDVKDAKENLSDAKTELKDAQAREGAAAKAKEVAEWANFKKESDSTIVSMENDLKKMEVKIQNAGKTDTKKLSADYSKVKSDMATMKEKLRQKNVEFESSITSVDNTISEKNQSFKREFKHDMDELGKSVKDLFKDNVK